MSQLAGLDPSLHCDYARLRSPHVVDIQSDITKSAGLDDRPGFPLIIGERLFAQNDLRATSSQHAMQNLAMELRRHCDHDEIRLMILQGNAQIFIRAASI